jgi:hypothetical protein
MESPHKGQLQLKKEMEDAKSKISVGHRYRHYKSKDMVYEIIGLGFLEVTDEICVIYQAQYGEKITFIRPLTIWLEDVSWKGKTVPRFCKL